MNAADGATFVVAAGTYHDGAADYYGIVCLLRPSLGIDDHFISGMKPGPPALLSDHHVDSPVRRCAAPCCRARPPR